MSDASLFFGREVGVRRGSFCNRRTRLAPTSVTAESSLVFWGDGLRCLALTRISRKLRIAKSVGYNRRRRKCFFDIFASL